jgi:hypothetical protein
MVSAAEDIGSAVHSAAITLIATLDGRPEKEWLVYRRAAHARGASCGGSYLPLIRQMAEISAARILAVCRRLANGQGGGRTAFRRSFHILSDEYWSWYADEDVERRLYNVLAHYAKWPPFNDTPLPYQIISTFELLYAVKPDDPELRSSVISRLAENLHQSPPKIRTNFEAWSAYSDLAAEVVRRLSMIPAPFEV